ncbi:unnamed protein product [Dracunculus medinensis]|uniref:F-box domain-containing protein n=1 Tax=Dracunculus medinensis TaxID=318479 RepID=A0A0N4U5I7_DRAME|nr:unnamed protein product [Dracunculus medinensis]
MQCAKHDKALMKEPFAKENELEQLHKQTAAKKHLLSISLLTKIFPIEEQIAEEEDLTEKDSSKEYDNSTMNDWTFLIDSFETAKINRIHFCIRSGLISDWEKYGLKQTLRIGLPQVSAVIVRSSSFNTLVNATHLVNLLCRVSLRDLLLCEKWSDDLFDTDMLKFNLTVIFLCIQLGVDECKIDVSNPFLNLIAARTRLLSLPFHEQMQPSEPTTRLLSRIDAIVAKVVWTERGHLHLTEDDWCMVQDDPFEICESSVFRSAFDLRNLITPLPRSKNWVRTSSGRFHHSPSFTRRFSAMIPDSIGSLFH